jgi:hypothetical protein
MGISSYRGPALGTWGKARLRGTLRWMKGARWMNCLPLSLKRLREGTWGGVPSLSTIKDTFGRPPDSGISLYVGPSVVRGTRHGGSYAGGFDE